MQDITKLKDIELLQMFALILNELKRRKITRTANNPLGDYAEWLTAQKLNLTLTNNSYFGCDAYDSADIRYQIKARRVHSENSSTQLSLIRNLKDKTFDVLIAIIFDFHFTVIRAVMVPHDLIEEYATFRAHTNGHVLHVRGPLLHDPRVKDITHIFRQA